MDLYFSEDRNAKMSMAKYLNNILREFPERLGDTVSLPSDVHLFKVQPEEEARVLLEEHTVAFHHTVVVCKDTSR